MAGPSLALVAVLQAAPAWYDRWAAVLIAGACLIAVVATGIYPWRWRLLGLGLLTFLIGSGLFFGRLVAGLFPSVGADYPAFRWPETLWLTRALLVFGAAAIATGYAWRIRVDWHDPTVGLSWLRVTKRLGKMLLLAAGTRSGLRLAHHGWGGDVTDGDVLMVGLAVVGLALLLWLRVQLDRRGVPK